MKSTSIKKDSISIRNIVIIVFIVLLLATVSVISYIVFSNWFSSANDTIEKISEDMNKEILNQVDEFINVPMHINEANHELIEYEIVDMNNEAEREKYFVGVLHTHMGNDVYSFSYGTENGEYYGARKNKNNEIEIMRNDITTNGESWYYAINESIANKITVNAGKFDPRTRDWYQAAKKSGVPVFSPVYKHFVMDDLTVSAAYPIYNKDKVLLGVLGTHITLTRIDNYLKEIVESKNAIALIMEINSRDLVANSFDINNFKTLEDGSVKRLTIDEIGNSAIIQAYNKYLNTNESNFIINNCKDKLYINLTPHYKDGFDWLVITAIPESLFIINIMENIKFTLLFTIVALVISILISYKVTNKYLKPIDTLIEINEKFANGDLHKRATIIRNDEIGMMSKSFNKMADTIYILINNLESKVKERTLELEETNNELKESKEQLHLILDSAVEAIFGLDNKGNCTYCNASCLAMLGYSIQDELIGKNMHQQIHHTYRDGKPMIFEDCMIHQAHLLGDGTHVNDEVFWRKDGTSVDVEYYSYPQYKDDKIVGLVVTFLDITESRKNLEHIKYLSRHDSLTGLYNRMFFDEELKRLDNKSNFPISIIFGDINGLKLTNDIFGHAVGDELIKKSAEILQKVCRESDVAARVGGDEFTILLPNTERKDARKIITRIKKEFAKERIVAIKGNISMGCATKINNDDDIETVMENAENAMYKEKTLNKKTINSDTINTIMETLHDKSPREKIHSINVSNICEKIGNQMKLSETEMKKLKEAGFYHDIGKIVLGDDILYENEEVFEEDSKEIHQHPIVGYRVLNSFEDTMDLAELVLSHHERWDGKGYPKGLKGEEIPLLARIIAVAEYYDEFTNSMNEKIFSNEEAVLKIKEEKGLKLDPKIIDAFTKLVDNGMVN
ncbi:diguanylate cyclase (GGDEF)-like protein/PAS domain S-box-containing protein/putative nucleotidyltransferase with HDIG domain [Sedimentibacter acidaminivorans]|uniref:Diguanylate cyclase (GGDEF)-like protein/PAS domain S-box-containing protein/putative nucleotidyltransferase with HDIG domain n=1 Tax=Sedimentibacter acidaminivorans TaxID=913099 RepID=A0ABS4G9Z5_9FIRM|nr:diguanylate cyclase [Sedimentibacter acidaminivorans]MBP1924357.1 diguanylate cyclase (GGDEF)-like protein/PAS domain S-box-containing protein/putative nucleotidyltransferase with HDIG domain [Sedimentibacter acidaminivorans]